MPRKKKNRPEQDLDRLVDLLRELVDQVGGMISASPPDVDTILKRIDSLSRSSVRLNALLKEQRRAQKDDEIARSRRAFDRARKEAQKKASQFRQLSLWEDLPPEDGGE